MVFIRYLLSIAAAIVITLALLWLMHTLIADQSQQVKRSESTGAIRFQDIKIDDTLQTNVRKPPPKPEPPKEPPPPQQRLQNQQTVESPLPDINMPNLDIGIGGAGAFIPGVFGAGGQNLGAEGDVIPIVRIQPQYPRQAAIAGISGWVDLEFTVTETGGVANPRVTKSSPPRIFDREAMRAVLRWKFKPRVVDGVPVARTATTRIEFNLNAEG